jgi:hypothetical protein
LLTDDVLEAAKAMAGCRRGEMELLGAALRKLRLRAMASNATIRDVSG